ncbi:MAG: PKD domain-containing protein [Thaumarchaeota archaeon]|nr:PKD domain-containing protein [Nitrososphaerota archaeon]
MVSKLLSLALVTILSLSGGVQNASAQQQYTSLTYNGDINIAFEDNQGYSNGRALVGNIKLPFTLTLNQLPYAGSNDISGSTTVQGTFSGSFKWGGSSPPSGCSTQYQITATYRTTIYGLTNVQANKVDMTGGYVSNVVETASPTPERTGCRGWSNGLGIESVLADCLGTQPNNGGYYTNAACHEFPIQGGSQTISRGTGNTAPKSVTGTIQLNLVDSKKVDSFDFDISVTPAELKVYKGGTATYTVSVSTIKGKAAQVTLSTPNVEGLGRLTLDRTVGTPPFDAKLTVPAGQANPGKYALQVLGTAGDVRKTRTVNLVVEDCPKFTITPTMPAANDPREFATPNGKASFRFDIMWEGKLPVSVGLNAAGAGGGAIQLSFAFNPVRMLNNKVNIIMDVTASNAGKGDYPIAVTATIDDPELPRECSSATTNVLLVVGDSRAQDLPLQPRPNPPQPPQNPPQPQPIKVADQQGNVTTKGNLVETGNNGKGKIPLGNTTLDVNNNTKVWKLNWDDIIDDDLIADDLGRRPPGLKDIINDKLKSIWEEIKPKLELKVGRTWHNIAEPVTEIIGCLFATSPEIADICSDKNAWYLEGGDVHYIGSLSKRRAEVHLDIIMTRNAIFVPNGTEFVLSLDKNGNTKLTMLEGSVLYIQLSTKQVMMLNATQQLAVQAQQAGGNNLVSNSITSVDFRSLDQWWIQSDLSTLNPLSVKIQLGDHIDPKLDAKTVPIALRASVSGGQAPYTYLWDMGDGIVKEGESVYYEYAKAGLYTVTLRVRDALDQAISMQNDVRVEAFGGSKSPLESQQQSPGAIASPSGIGDEVTGTILGTLIVFMGVIGAFLRPFRIRNKQPPSLDVPKTGRSKFRPRKIALLGALLIFVPLSVMLSLTSAVGISEGLAIGTVVITWVAGFLLLFTAIIKLIIGKVRKKNS